MDSRYSRRALLGMAAGLGLPRFTPAATNSRFIRSQNGLLEATIEARQMRVEIGARMGNIYSYNGISPGPTLEAWPGDTVRLTLLNRLAESTNLHFHGMHLSPSGKADNALLDIPAGESFTYEFVIPANHEPGLYWYHPHFHGLVAKQVNWGLAGMFLVHGGLDYVPEIADAREHLVVLQDFALNGAGMPMGPMMAMDYHRGREGAHITTNGFVDMPIGVARGGWLRLRLLNASASRFYLLHIRDHTMFQIGTDGGAIASPVEMDRILLTPGERADLMVPANRPAGEFALMNMPFDRTGGGLTGMAPQTLARIVYLDMEGRDYNLPQRLSSIAPLPNPDGVRTIRMTDEMRMAGGMMVMGEHGPDPMMMGLFIDGRPFDARRIDTRVRLGTVEDWTVVNDGSMDHPFHVHTNTFQVLDGNMVPERAWRDIVQIPRKSQKTFRMRFDDFTGLTVYHCHILDHEDLGMMGTLQIDA